MPQSLAAQLVFTRKPFQYMLRENIVVLVPNSVSYPI
jgi:hypothetical protein